VQLAGVPWPTIWSARADPAPASVNPPTHTESLRTRRFTQVDDREDRQD
jgi:hypothetical protein